MEIRHGPTQPGIRTQYYSNPNVYHNGRATGTADSDNARVLRQMMSQVENNRGHRIRLSENSSTHANIDFEGDYDLFQIEITQEGMLTVGTTGNTDTYGVLLNAAGNMLAENDDVIFEVNTNFQIIKHVNPGTYYIEISHFDPREHWTLPTQNLTDSLGYSDSQPGHSKYWGRRR